MNERLFSFQFIDLLFRSLNFMKILELGKNLFTFIFYYQPSFDMLFNSRATLGTFKKPLQKTFKRKSMY